ncbi:hypothetical protein MKX03_032630 [Papaver bracteatum]|nr:hypothetical protein MKX03_032630 [Papaver bracteatum]
MSQEMCPIDIVKLGGCVDVLSGIVGISIGGSAKEKCCPLLQGIGDLDAALCLCTAIEAKVLNVNIVLPIALKVLINDCGKHPPPGFNCPTSPPPKSAPPTPTPTPKSAPSTPTPSPKSAPPTPTPSPKSSPPAPTPSPKSAMPTPTPPPTSAPPTPTPSPKSAPPTPTPSPKSAPPTPTPPPESAPPAPTPTPSPKSAPPTPTPSPKSAPPTPTPPPESAPPAPTPTPSPKSAPPTPTPSPKSAPPTPTPPPKSAPPAPTPTPSPKSAPPTPAPAPTSQEMCPIDIVKLGGCVDVLSGIVGIRIGGSAKEKCCPLLQGIADLDAALCLCTAIEAKVLNVNIVLPIALKVLINDCGKHPPPGFNCPTNDKSSPPPKLAPPIVAPPTATPPPTQAPTPPATTPAPMEKAMCPVDAIKLGGCVDVLGGTLGIVIGGSAKEKCCPLLEGITDLDAALCLCTTIKAKVLNVSIVLPIALQVLIQDCGKHPPPEFTCPT